jgi:hypothetical protein
MPTPVSIGLPERGITWQQIIQLAGSSEIVALHYVYLPAICMKRYNARKSLQALLRTARAGLDDWSVILAN